MDQQRELVCGFRRTGLAIAIAMALAFTGQTAFAQNAAGSEMAQSTRFELPSDPGQVVISMTEHIHMMVLPTYPSVSIYADGRVVRHVPAGFQHAGDYEGRISMEEMTSLVQALSQRGVLDFDSRSVLERKREADAASDVFHYVSDPTTIEIEVRLDSYQSGAGVAPTIDFERTVSWTGLQHDAGRYPDIREIRNLDAAYRQLETLAQRVERESRVGGGS